MSKYTKQFKLAVIKRYLKNPTSFHSVGQHYAIDASIVRNWVKRYQQRGADGLGKKFSHYNVEFRLSVLQHMWDQQLSYAQTALLFDIRSPGCLGVWERSYHSGGIDALTPRTRGRPKNMSTPPTPKPPSVNDDESRSREELLTEVTYLRMENAYLKKLKALVQQQTQTTSRKKRR
jgi:transposase